MLGFVAVNKDEKILEQLNFYSATVLAAFHRILTKLPEIPDELYKKYQAVFFCFLFKKQLRYLEPLLDALLGKQG